MNPYFKSTAVLAIAASLASSAFAQDTEVFSLNVVGFQKVNIPSNAAGGLYLQSNPFDQEECYIDKVVGTNGVAGATLGVADNVMLYDKYNQVYLTYWLYSSANPLYNRRWRSTPGFATNVYLYPGMGYWYRNRASSNVSLVLVGDAVSDGCVTNTIVPGLQLLSYPFSTSIRMTDLTLTNGVAGATLGVADNIIIFEPTNQTFSTYWLYSNANPAYNRKWRSTPGLATNVFLTPGKGFWYRSRLSTTNLWVECRPYTF